MQFSASTLLALAAIIPSTLAHMYVSYPPVYQADTDNKRSPLHPDGSNYPCYDLSGTDGPEPTYQAGSSQKFVISGSAVHGGGSCQMSITYDVPPRKDSPFYVIKSWNGACPVDDAGNLGYEGNFNLDYTIPANMPQGKAIIAWTWFNRRGNREMYMRCAPVNIQSSFTDMSAVQSLPTIFKAHIANIGVDPQCFIPEDEYFSFPNPGRDVVTGSVAGVIKPAPAACGPTVGTPTAPETPEVEAPVEEPTGQPSGKPIEFIGQPDKPDVANPPVVVVPPTTTGRPVTTATVVPVKPEAPVKPEVPVKPAPSGGNCPEDGAIICTTASTWAICDHGIAVPMGRVAPGMVCRGGAMEFAKREVRGMRFGHEHRRRHHAKRL